MRRSLILDQGQLSSELILLMIVSFEEGRVCEDVVLTSIKRGTLQWQAVLLNMGRHVSPTNCKRLTTSKYFNIDNSRSVAGARDC